MYSDRTWNYWVLIPFWAVHFLFLFAFVGVFAVNMMEVAGEKGYVPGYGHVNIADNDTECQTDRTSAPSQHSCSSSA